jgi:hypothetical protein
MYAYVCDYISSCVDRAEFYRESVIQVTLSKPRQSYTQAQTSLRPPSRLSILPLDTATDIISNDNTSTTPTQPFLLLRVVVDALPEQASEAKYKHGNLICCCGDFLVIAVAYVAVTAAFDFFLTSFYSHLPSDTMYMIRFFDVKVWCG